MPSRAGTIQADSTGSYGFTTGSSGANTLVLTSGETLTLPSQEASGEDLWFHFLSTLASFFTSLKTSYFRLFPSSPTVAVLSRLCDHHLGCPTVEHAGPAGPAPEASPCKA